MLICFCDWNIGSLQEVFSHDTLVSRKCHSLVTWTEKSRSQSVIQFTGAKPWPCARCGLALANRYHVDPALSVLPSLSARLGQGPELPLLPLAPVACAAVTFPTNSHMSGLTCFAKWGKRLHSAGVVVSITLWQTQPSLCHLLVASLASWWAQFAIFNLW